MKKNKIILLTSLSIISPSLAVIAAKCNDNKKPSSTNEKSINELNSEQFKKLIESTNDVNQLVSFKFSNGGREVDLSQILPSQVEENTQNLSVTVNSKYTNVISAIVVNANTEKKLPTIISNAKGELDVSLLFTNKKTNETVSKTFKLKGLKTNGGMHHSGLILRDPIDSFGGSDGFKKYLGMTQDERFKHDNNLYLSNIKNYWGDDGALKARGLESVTADQKKEFDEKAAKLKLDSYDSAAAKGFSLPVFNSEGKVEGLKLFEREVAKAPSHVDTLGRDIYKTNGLARTIPNETYKTIAKQTYQVTFNFEKDFRKELAEIDRHIKFFEDKNEEQIKSYLESQIKILDQNLESKLKEINNRWNSYSDEAKKGLKESHKKEIEEAERKHKEERSKYLSWKKDDLINWQREEKKKIEEKKSQKLGGRVSGTMWIMDFVKPENGQRAQRFFFGTNSHVARTLKEHNLTAFSLSRINSNVGVGATLKFNDYDPNFTKFSFSKPSGIIKTVFDGIDFLKTSPKSYIHSSQKADYENVEEYIDFAVVEIDFTSVNPSDVIVWKENKQLHNYAENNKDKLIEEITNGYEKDIKNHIKFKSTSYLDNYNSIDVPLAVDEKIKEQIDNWNSKEGLFILGYPRAEKDYYLERYIDDELIKISKENFSLWVNGDHKWYKQLAVQEGQQPAFSKHVLENGGRLSYQIGYRTFTDKPGLVDGFLGASRIGDDLYSIYDKYSKKENKYVNYGLHLAPRFYAPNGGASGSSVRNKKNELIAVFHSSNDWAKTGLAAVFRSPGKEYDGLFGAYNLPQYDLIYGGGKEQKKSYREALKTMYGTSNSQFKTNLFNKGLEDEHIPSEFKFTTPAK
ncbi:variable surface lipoprotein [Mycoplasma bovis]|uniref:Ig-specific serine endopeptidase MIP n=1 Tax=Mycoplasmopsis bovis TaxID=28903 RepID=UPI001431BAFD|nr:variable surface lipoprotein [Mycoplasmopsis bovis]MBT1325556.1 variable surface lipoprotein [Mycoplasmopsis bovis]MBT1371432.1 variable surface lipoprotein [Mycoplasmopsis bovis]MBT1379774.1 variable surface lipoprotein [Mycoplasmopsis bovis]MBT1380516.1 variable surface lipoprotein [Mycoplasmopsis bovis]MBT1383804.1 variable surface lipoprotein [Mycoplasmopsis bovis]